MAAKAEEPLATAADSSPSPSTESLLRRASPENREEEKESRETKRRRTCVAALESLETEKEDSLDSFSFEARSVAPIETTPKFGSFNPVLLVETITVESTEVPLPEKVSDGSVEEVRSGADGEVEKEAERKEEGEEGGASEGNNGNSDSTETE